jgi:hypothetical protein
MSAAGATGEFRPICATRQRSRSTRMQTSGRRGKLLTNSYTAHSNSGGLRPTNARMEIPLTSDVTRVAYLVLYMIVSDS